MGAEGAPNNRKTNIAISKDGAILMYDSFHSVIISCYYLFT